MTPVSRLEKWIAPRAVPLLAVISVLVIGSGVAAYFVREADLNRVERLERVILCQHNRQCREFVERAIREILRDQETPRNRNSEKHQGVTFQLGPKTENSPPPLVVEVDSGDGHSEGQDSPTQAPKPHGKQESDNPAMDIPRDTKQPSRPTEQPNAEVPQRQPRVATFPVPPEPVGPVTAGAEAVEEAVESVKEIPCSALREVHKLC